MSKASVELLADGADGWQVRIRAEDPALIGREATLGVDLFGRVKDKRPVDTHRTLFEQRLRLESAETLLPLPASALHRVYRYAGKQLDVDLVLRLAVGSGVRFSVKVEDASLPFGDRPRLGSHDGKEIDPADAYSFFANLAAIPARNRLITLGLTAVGGLVIVANAVLGLHDQLVPEAQTLFYDHSGSDGSESPLMKALMGSGAVGLGIWLAIKFQLKKYMRFALKPHPPIRRGLRLPAGELIDGQARVDLEDITVRVIACNRECGQYRRGSGTKVRTVSFKTPTRAVKLYERYLAHVPAGVPLASYLEGEVDFEPMFADLYPPLKVGNSHGVEVMWEAQLLHPKFVDHEEEGTSGELRFDDFLDP